VTETRALEVCAGWIERSLEMPDYYHTLRNVLLALLLPEIAAGFTNSAKPAMVEQILQAIRMKRTEGKSWG